MFIMALLLAAPALVFQWLALTSNQPAMFVGSWTFGAGLYLATLTYLLRYVFHRDVMTGDKLWGAAAAYLMLGVPVLTAGALPPALLCGGRRGDPFRYARIPLL